MTLLSLLDALTIRRSNIPTALAPAYFQATFQIGRLLRLLPADCSQFEIETMARVRPFTMTSLARIVSLMRATEHVARQQIPGAIVECGVWRGGSMMAAALTLLRLGEQRIPLYLFDTFAGMTRPGDADGAHAQAKWQINQSLSHNHWCYASLADVKRNLDSTGYDRELINFVEGEVEMTIPAQAPHQISLLRLDTDWYASTWHELNHLFPRLASGGILIVDDYGRWPGCQKAVDEFIKQNRLRLFLSRIDYTGRISVKP
jgi:O-methyltransferase